MTLAEFFTQNPEVALAFSGGADSACLLWAAARYGRRVCAYYVRSPFQPAFEQADAERLAGQLGAQLRVLELDVLADARIAANPAGRCYYCKRRIFEAIQAAAAQDGFALLIDGTNASDDDAGRPGMRALRELGVRSPLRECGLTKTQVRAISREAGLFTWDKPAYACLATRIPAGEAITRQKLEITEQAEAYLASLGFSDFRVRWRGGNALLQLPQSQLPQLLANRAPILQTLRQWYGAVALDLEVRG